MPNTSSGPAFIDTHCHVTELRKKGLDPVELLDDFLAPAGSCIIDAGLTPDDVYGRLPYTEKHPGLFLSMGLHPHQAVDFEKYAGIFHDPKLHEHSRIIAIGETGLDYYRNNSPKAEQQMAFSAQMEIAETFNRPLIIHNRDADDDVYDMLKKKKDPSNAVFHCFSSNTEFARKVLDLGCYISFAGNLTFKNAQEIQKAAKIVPLDRILLETDAPYLAPEPKRGGKNHPALIRHTYEFCARLKSVSLQQLVAAVRKNTRDLFKISLQE